MKFVIRGTICLLLALGMAACASPTLKDTSQWNPDLYAVDEDDAHIAVLKAQAAQDPQAAYDLALRYFRGDGVRRNNHQAVSWMRVAAEKGDLAAQKALGTLYLTGLETIGKDPNEAHAWLSLAASRGDSESQQLLAEAEAAKRSNEEEFRWLSRWLPVLYSRWWHGYPYYYKWRHGKWIY